MSRTIRQTLKTEDVDAMLGSDLKLKRKLRPAGRMNTIVRDHLMEIDLTQDDEIQLITYVPIGNTDCPCVQCAIHEDPTECIYLPANPAGFEEV